MPSLTDEAPTPIGSLEWRRRARVAGRVRSLRVRPWGDVPSLELVLMDETGGVTLAFLGRRRIAGIELGTHLCAEGMVGPNRDRLVILNPAYELIPLPSVPA